MEATQRLDFSKDRPVIEPGLHLAPTVAAAETTLGAAPLAFLAGGGECAVLIGERDWAATPLGPIERWPQSLKTATAILLRSPVPIVMLWGEQGVMLYNDGYSAFAGGRHPKLLGSNVREGWPEVADFNDTVMRQCLSGKVLRYSDQELTLHRHGRPEQVWMDLDYSPVLDESGSPAGVICFLGETTEKVAAARRSEHLLNLSDNLRLLGSDSEIMSAAAAGLGDQLNANRIFYAEIASGLMTVEHDYTRGVPSIVGQHSLEAFGPDLLNAYRTGMPVVVSDVATDPRLSADARAGLLSRHVGAFIDVVLFEEDEWVGLLAVQSATPRVWTAGEQGFVQDVGERVKAAIERARGEASLRELKDTLEQRVIERTAELMQTEEALRQAQKMEAVGQLTGGIAHDFNNMLTGVIGGLDLVQRNLANGRMDKVERYIDAATTSAQRAAALTSRLLAFGRRQSLDLKAIDVNNLVSGMEDLLCRTLGEQVALETHCADDLWPARSDTNQLESALLNLCINARDAMPEGGLLTVETANVHLDEYYVRDQTDIRPGDYVTLSVTDTGIGMAPTTLQKVFEPFFTTKPTGQGTGLGLSMIYGFARQAGGHVRIYSELGNGTTVKLFIPRCEDELEASAQTTGDVPLGAGETVLVVEDDPSVRMIILDVLGELGYGAIEAVDAVTAIPILESKKRIDLLVSDVGLPGMNGRQLAEIARQLRPDLRVLFITGYAQNAAVRGGFLDPGMDMMTKPFAVDALATKLRQILEN